MSLFTGVGGLEKHLINDNKINLVGVSEIDASASSVLKYHHPDIQNFGDITDIRPNKLPDFDILTGGFPCFKAGTLIYTINGHKRIENIVVGDYVLTHRCRFKRVTQVGSNKAPITKLRAQGILNTYTTHNHPYMTISKSNGRNCRIINSEEKWTEVENLTKDNFIGVPVIPTIDSHEQYSDSLLWLIGRFVADGYCQNQKRKERKNSYNTKSIFCIGYAKVSAFEDMLKESEIAYTKSPNKTVVKYICCKKELFDIFVECGHLAKNKVFPQWVMMLPKERLEVVLRGYLSGDGHLDKCDRWNCSTISKKLAMQICLVVTKVFNVGCTTSYTKPCNAVIEGRSVSCSAIYAITFKEHTVKQARYFFSNNKTWLPVKSIETTNEVCKVYNMSVEDDESYTANNAIVHNCTSISTQGNQAGFSKGSKSSLFFYMLPIIKEKKPKFIIIENVKNLLSKQMSNEYETIIREVRNLGYKTGTKVLDSSQYGTPQQRVRVVIFGVRKEIKQVGKSNCDDVFNKNTKVKGFKGLDDECSYISWSKSTRKEHIDFRIREDGLINTLTTGGGCKGASTGTIVMTKDGDVRNLTVRECEALMTWEKDKTKYGIDDVGSVIKIPDAKRYRMCGNGVASNIILPFKNIILSTEV